MNSEGGRHGSNVVNSCYIWCLPIFRRGRFLDAFRIPFRSPFWGHFGAKIVHYTLKVAKKTEKGRLEDHFRSSFFWQNFGSICGCRAPPPKGTRRQRRNPIRRVVYGAGWDRTLFFWPSLPLSALRANSLGGSWLEPRPDLRRLRRVPAAAPEPLAPCVTWNVWPSRNPCPDASGCSKKQGGE